MLKQFSQLGVISSLPFGFPADLESLVLGDQIFMDVLEVEGIGPVFGDILNMAVDLVDGLPAVMELF